MSNIDHVFTGTSTSGSDSDFEALNETIVYNTGKTNVGSVANSKGGREDVAEIRSRLRKALFSCVSVNKLKLHLKAQEEFENYLCQIMAIASPRSKLSYIFDIISYIYRSFVKITFFLQLTVSVSSLTTK